MIHPIPPVEHSTETTLRSPIPLRGYTPPAGSRIVGGAGTCAIFLLVVAATFVGWSRYDPPPGPSAPLVVSLLPLAKPSPPRPQAAAKRPEAIAKPEKAAPVPRPRSVATRLALPPIKPAAESVASAPPQAAPQVPAQPAPAVPAIQPQGSASDSWEGRVLARIQKFRRYPADARDAHQQGVVYLRFRMDRDGHVLSATVAQSSGFSQLDRAALDTLRRADPLPKIPADKPDQLDLSVPVEFFISVRP